MLLLPVWLKYLHDLGKNGAREKGLLFFQYFLKKESHGGLCKEVSHSRTMRAAICTWSDSGHEEGCSGLVDSTSIQPLIHTTLWRIICLYTWRIIH